MSFSPPPGPDPRFPYGTGGPQQYRQPTQPVPASGISTPRALTGPAVVTETRRKFPWWAWLVALAATVFAVFIFVPGLQSPSDWFGGGGGGSGPTLPSVSTATPVPDPDPTPSDPAPLEPLGNGDVVGKWEIELIEVNLDATDLLDSFGKEMLETGKTVIGIKLRFTNLGEVAAEPTDSLFSELRIPGEYRAGYGEYYIDSDQQFFLMDPVESGEQAEAWLYYEAPEGFSSGELWFVDFEDYLSDPILIEIS